MAFYLFQQHIRISTSFIVCYLRVNLKIATFEEQFSVQAQRVKR